MEWMRKLLKLRMLSKKALRSLGYRYMQMLRMQLNLGLLRIWGSIGRQYEDGDEFCLNRWCWRCCQTWHWDHWGGDLCGLHSLKVQSKQRILRKHLQMEWIRKLPKMMMLSMLPNMELRRLGWRFMCMLRIQLKLSICNCSFNIHTNLHLNFPYAMLGSILNILSLNNYSFILFSTASLKFSVFSKISSQSSKCLAAPRQCTHFAKTKF